MKRRKTTKNKIIKLRKRKKGLRGIIKKRR